MRHCEAAAKQFPLLINDFPAFSNKKSWLAKKEAPADEFPVAAGIYSDATEQPLCKVLRKVSRRH